MERPGLGVEVKHKQPKVRRWLLSGGEPNILSYGERFPMEVRGILLMRYAAHRTISPQKTVGKLDWSRR